MSRIFFLLVFILSSVTIHSQTVALLSEGTKTSIRGLSVVNDRIIWASGSNGTIGKSIDGGNTWKWSVVKGFEKRDFRDIEAFDAATAIIIAVAEPASILKTVDGGETWKVVYENNSPGMFLDAMEFWNEQSGIVLGDPIKGKFFIARTFNGGNTWKEVPFENLPAADSGEACFAASGTNIRALDRDEACFVSGGLRSRLFWKGTPIELPIIQGTESTGANSVAVRDRKKLKGSLHLVVVGGDFAADSSTTKNCFVTTDGGKTWKSPAKPPQGYRSCVEYITQKRLVTCGTSGVDISEDGGMNWKFISKQGYHVCRKAKEGNSVFLAGGNGRIAKLEWK
ncbi:MAG TPA: oxidoreductase [Chitinophagaceae bacterium]